MCVSLSAPSVVSGRTEPGTEGPSQIAVALKGAPSRRVAPSVSRFARLPARRSDNNLAVPPSWGLGPADR